MEHPTACVVPDAASPRKSMPGWAHVATCHCVDCDLARAHLPHAVAPTSDTGVRTDVREDACKLLEHTLATACALVASEPQPLECPACEGAGRACGLCSGLGFLPTEAWGAALQRAFTAAAGLILPLACDTDDEDLDDVRQVS